MLNDSGMRSRGNDGAKGSLYIENYRSALSRLQYVSNGEVAEYSPSFTFFGYRYLEIIPDNDIEILYVVSDKIGSDLKRLGTIETSNAEVNKLIGNIYRGLESNYLSVPTDCPQRDERYGWTGDTQVFCGAASYFVNAYGFLSKWMGDMRDSKDPDGVFPFIAPAVFGPKSFGTGAAAWCDAGIVVPYKMWLMYGDRSILEENYEAMENHIKGLYERNGLAGPMPGFGDWLCYEENHKECVAVCYFAYDAILMEKISRILGKSDRAEYYAKLRADINAYYNDKIEKGEFKLKTQTDYILPLAFDMFGRELREKAIKELKAKIVDNDYTLATGFVGTGHLNQTLSKVGLNDEAYSLLLQTKDPSWLYSVRQGATTIWERWNSYTLEKGFGDVNMNSFNHYAYGAVAEWMFADMAGIKPVEDYPGFEKFILAPTPDTREFIPEGQERITSVKAEYESSRGLIKSAWCYENGEFVYRATVPAKTEATVYFPLLSGKTTVNVNGLEFAENGDFKIQNGKMIFTLTAGEYVIK
jgi:alpha-L-rhamnosidase